MPPESVLDWEPDPERALLGDLERYTVDTADFAGDRFKLDLADSKLRCVAVPFLVPAQGGVIAGLDAVHVTDDPAAALEIIKAGGDLQESRPYGDICGGLYVSACPDFWASRSRKKWEFMETLSAESHEQLREAIERRVDEERATGYITASERENALSVLSQWRDTGYWQVATIVAGQPFNIDIQDLARELKLAEPARPFYVPVRFQGRYLEVMDRAAWKIVAKIARSTFGVSDQMLTQQDLCAALRRHGWDGAFTRAGMSTNPELVIWSAGKILMFGDWAAPTPTLSGIKQRGRGFQRLRV